MTSEFRPLRPTPAQLPWVSREAKVDYPVAAPANTRTPHLHRAEILKNTMRVLATKCFDCISANEARCRYYANATISIAAALNLYIGYAAAAEIAKESVKRGRPVAEIALERDLLDAVTLREILDPMRMTTPMAPIRQALRKAKRGKRKPSRMRKK